MKNSRLNAILFFVAGVAFLILVFYAHFHNPQWYLPTSASLHGLVTDHLFNLTMWITLPVFCITQALLFLFVLLFPHREDKKADYYPNNHKLELIWTIVPGIVLTWLIVQGLQTWANIKSPAPADAMVIEVTAEQFAWNFRWPGKDGKFGRNKPELMKAATNPIGIDFDDSLSHDDITSKEIFIPVGKTVLFNIQAKDVIHSFYLPHFRVKMDAVPGMRTSFWMNPTMTSVEKKEEVKRITLGMKEVDQRLYGQVSDETYKDANGNIIVEKGGLIKRAERDQNGNLVKSTDVVLRLIKAGIKEINAYHDFNYVLACAELCGLGHYKMRAAMTVVTQQEYDKWMSEQTPDFEYQ